MTILYGEIMTKGEPGKPFVAVYIREFPLMSPADFHRARGGVIRFARSRGLSVDEIFEEKLESIPKAFTAMTAKLQLSPGNVLIMPSAHHLTGLGDNPLDILKTFYDFGVEVLIAGHAE